ncbi:hypothetical protein GF343_03440 [Candidatus Woesearchaeota archaeon]|nr:hypothetical protein [Candidatus Woesearchaeota archaeon]
MDEHKSWEDGELGAHIGRKTNFDDFAKQFSDKGYEMLNKSDVVNTPDFWTEDNELRVEMVTLLTDPDKKTITIVHKYGLNKAEKTQLAEEFKQMQTKITGMQDQLAVKVPEQPEEMSVLDIQDTEEYQELEDQVNARDDYIRALLAEVFPSGAAEGREFAELLGLFKTYQANITGLRNKISSLKDAAKPYDGLKNAFDTLCKKLDAVAAEVLEQEPEAAEPDAKDSTIDWIVGKVKSAKDSAVTAIFRKKQEEQEPETPSVEHALEVLSYIKTLDKIMSVVKAYKAQVAGYKQSAENAVAEARQAKEAPAGLDEKAENLLNELSDAVADVPAADEINDSAFMAQYVSEVRRCAFELYSIAASRDPEVMYFVLSELAGSAYDDGKKAEAESYAARARNLCKEKLSDNLKEAEENLAFYRAEIKE